MSTVRITHVGTACVLLECEGLRILTDPVFDPAGSRYDFGWGTGSTKLTPPAISPDALGKLDAILLSHDQHADNLDSRGREILSRAGRVVTTRRAARRLPNATGLAPWETTTLRAPSGVDVRITATPARHGPPLSLPFVGPVVGFALEWPGQTNGAIYFSGDTVLFRGLDAIPTILRVGTALLHMGGVGFPLFGPLRFTMNARHAARLSKRLDAKTFVPIHYDGWTHFLEPRADAERAFADAGVTAQWLVPGVAREIEV